MRRDKLLKFVNIGTQETTYRLLINRFDIEKISAKPIDRYFFESLWSATFWRALICFVNEHEFISVASESFFLSKNLQRKFLRQAHDHYTVIFNVYNFVQKQAKKTQLSPLDFSWSTSYTKYMKRPLSEKNIFFKIPI